ncbi:MAG: leucine-rich repeat domain-containing protein, partial [Firmicutes bacterium]|nr:leucine-rich repeat domain-containing protein [Bacillota bacterium]
VNIGDNAFLNNRTYLTTINLPSTLKRIGASSLNGCRSLVFEGDTIRLPRGLEYIGGAAFTNVGNSGRGISKVFIPNSVTYVGGTVLYGVQGTVDVYCEATDPTVDAESTATGWSKSWNQYANNLVIHWGASDVE